MKKRPLLSHISDVENRPEMDGGEAPQLALVGGGTPRSGHENSLSISDIQRFGEDWVYEAISLRRSKSTIAGKRDAIEKLLWYLNRQRWDRCGTRELRRFIMYVATSHEEPGGRWGNPQLTEAASDRTVEYYANHMRGFCRWMCEDDTVPVNVDFMHGVKTTKVNTPPIQPFEQNHIEALLQAAKRSTNPKRDTAILLFMLDTGVRASELCGLTYGDLELHGSYGQAKVLGKGRKIRIVPFSRKAARFLWGYLQEVPRVPTAPVFLSDRGTNGTGAPLTRSGLQQIYERLGAAAGIQSVRCSPHTMRHTFAINFLRNGGNVFTLQTILGHSDLKMTQRYCRIAQADVTNQHRQFSPADAMTASGTTPGSGKILRSEKTKTIASHDQE